MEHFRVLPSDRRIQELDDVQIALLFQYWVEFDEDLIRQAAREELRKPRFDEAALRSMGYSEDQIAEIKRTF